MFGRAVDLLGAGQAWQGVELRGQHFRVTAYSQRPFWDWFWCSYSTTVLLFLAYPLIHKVLWKRVWEDVKILKGSWTFFKKPEICFICRIRHVPVPFLFWKSCSLFGFCQVQVSCCAEDWCRVLVWRWPPALAQWVFLLQGLHWSQAPQTQLESWEAGQNKCW